MLFDAVDIYGLQAPDIYAAVDRFAAEGDVPAGSLLVDVEIGSLEKQLAPAVIDLEQQDAGTFLPMHDKTVIGAVTCTYSSFRPLLGKAQSQQ